MDFLGFAGDFLLFLFNNFSFEYTYTGIMTLENTVLDEMLIF